MRGYSALNLLLSAGLLVIAGIAIFVALQPGHTGWKAAILTWFTAP